MFAHEYPGGETLKIYVSTDPVTKYKIDIFRMGYYGGKGARLVKSVGPLQGVMQPIPEDGEREGAGMQMERGIGPGDSKGVGERSLSWKADGPWIR